MKSQTKFINKTQKIYIEFIYLLQKNQTEIKKSCNSSIK